MGMVFLGVLSSIIAAVLIRVMMYTVSSHFYGPYVDMRGIWIGEKTFGDKQERHIEVCQQFWKYLSGYYTVANPDNIRDIRRYNFKGRFVSHDTMIGEFRLAKSNFPDVNAFVMKVDIKAKDVSGAVAGFDFQQKDFAVGLFNAHKE